MDKKLLAAIAILMSLAWTACSSDHFKRAAYEAEYQNGCVDRVGVRNCNAAYPIYVQYQADRERMVKRDAP